MFYSKATGGFYDRAIHSKIPADAVEITADEHAALLLGQSRGQVISGDEFGRPVLVSRPEMSDEQRAAVIRGKRDQLLAGSDWAVLPDVQLSTVKREAWLQYRQALREVPTQPTFPASVVWPKQPG